MTPINMTLPPGVKVRGAIYPTLDPECLDSELLQMELPNGVFIDVGWYPSGDPHGAFYVTAFLSSWDHRLKRESTRSPREAASIAESWAQRYLSTQDRYYMLSDASSTTTDLSASGGSAYWQAERPSARLSACGRA
jgi:hypothetical protein